MSQIDYEQNSLQLKTGVALKTSHFKYKHILNIIMNQNFKLGRKHNKPGNGLAAITMSFLTSYYHTL